MNGRDSFKRCKHCGKMIGIIRERAYRKIIVDADAHLIVPDPLGDIYVRIDGSKTRGRDVGMTETGYPAYKPHRCGVNPDEV